MSNKASLTTSIGAGTGTSLAKLPPEILHVVGSHLDEKDARVLRLTCTRIGDVASCYAFPTLTFYLHPGDFEMLQYFANHSIISRNVKSLVYFTDMLPEKRLSFKKFVAQKKHQDGMYYKYTRNIQPPAARARRPAQQPKYTEAEFQAAYDDYVDAHSRQTAMLANGDDFRFLRDIIPNFTALTDMMVSAGNHYREGQWPRTPFEPLFVKADDQLEPTACRHIGSLLLPLVGLGPRLRDLTVGAVAPSFVSQFEDPVKFSQMVDICRNLTTLDLTIDTGMNEDNEVGIWVDECKAIFRTGVMRRLLGAMTNLVSLTIHFTFIDERTEDYPARFGDLVSKDAHWAHLEHVRFDVIEAPRQDLVDFIGRHTSTLRSIEIRSLRLIESSWHVFLPQLRELADDMFLDNIEFTGYVHGETERADLDPELREEHFDFGEPEVSEPVQLSEDITDYIIWGQGPNPLDAYRDYD